MTGWKICMEIRCTINTPIYLNIAVLAPKQTTNDTIEATNFFRNNEDARSMDFSINRTGLEMHCCPINSDDYTILKHRRYVLNTVNQPTASWSKQSGSSWINVNWWVPYDDKSVTSQENHLRQLMEEYFTSSGLMSGATRRVPLQQIAPPSPARLSPISENQGIKLTYTATPATEGPWARGKAPWRPWEPSSAATATPPQIRGPPRYRAWPALRAVF